MTQQQNQSTFLSGLTPAGVFGLVRLVMRTWSYSIEVFLRFGFGSRYAVLESLLVIPLVLIYTVSWKEGDLQPMLWFLQAYFAMCFINRVGTLFCRDRRTPFYYTGWPRLSRLFFWLPERTLKLCVEPCLVGGVAVGIGESNPPLCVYLIIAGCCLIIENFLIEQQVERGAKEMYERMQWQQTVAERFRERYSGQF
jgi:hypothetical protein